MVVQRGDTIDLHDDVDILDSTPHQNGVKLYLLEPAGEYECGAETSDGETCSIEVAYPTDTCHHHIPIT